MTEQETQMENKMTEGFITKSITYTKGLRASINVSLHINQQTGTFWIDVNGCQETNETPIPNWAVWEFKRKGCGSYFARLEAPDKHGSWWGDCINDCCKYNSIGIHLRKEFPDGVKTIMGETIK